MYFYARLNTNSICVELISSTKAYNTDDVIAIDSYSDDYLWRKYENGQWSEGKYEPQSTAPITEFEEAKQRLTDLELAMAAVLGGAV